MIRKHFTLYGEGILTGLIAGLLLGIYLGMAIADGSAARQTDTHRAAR